MTTSTLSPFDEDILEHFGVKGMRWGVRKEEERSSRKKAEKSSGSANNPYALTDEDKAVLRGAGVKESDSESLKSKYGPGTLSGDNKKSRFTQEQKDMATALVVSLGVAAGAWYLYHRAYQAEQNAYFKRINPVEGAAGKKNLSAFRREWNTYVNKSVGSSGGLTKEAVAGFSSEDTNLKAGTIFKRLSTERETNIRPGGFYASYKDEDTARYKAILPVFWKQWGRGGTSGYVVNIKANQDIKAPSPKATYEKFKGMLNDDVPGSGVIPGRKLRDYYPGGRDGGDDDTIARKLFPNFAGMWANEDHPGTRHFFGKLKEDGFNAVVDMNDMGKLASKPMRLLDGTMFSIDGHERVSSSAIATAQANIRAIAHAALALMGMQMIAGEEYLAHAGVKGMKWGIRKKREPLSPRNQRRKEVVVKAAMAVGAVAVGAILLKRGGFKVSSPASKKIALGGAKASLKIITKSGKLMATTSVKVGNTVGKTTVKGTAKVGTLAGKGVYKGALAGSKAAGRAAAQNGSKFYEKVLKKSAVSSYKLGSHAMYKFTGKGTPIVKEAAKRSFAVSPTDLLLNVRADKWRGR